MHILSGSPHPQGSRHNHILRISKVFKSVIIEIHILTVSSPLFALLHGLGGLPTSLTPFALIPRDDAPVSFGDRSTVTAWATAWTTACRRRGWGVMVQTPGPRPRNHPNWVDRAEHPNHRLAQKRSSHLRSSSLPVPGPPGGPRRAVLACPRRRGRSGGTGPRASASLEAS